MSAARPSFPAVSVEELACARDRALVRRIAERGDDAAGALAALFNAYGPTALALARRVTRQDQLAEEVTQEAFLALWTSPGSYNTAKGTARAYLLTAVHHLAVDAVRREQTQSRRHREQASEPLRHDPDIAEEVIARGEEERSRTAVSLALATLPVEQRQVVQMMYFDGRSQRSIAEELRLPLGTVKSRALLAMRKLRVLLTESTWRGAHE